jgi:hypothetical protein
MLRNLVFALLFYRRHEFSLFIKINENVRKSPLKSKGSSGLRTGNLKMALFLLLVIQIVKTYFEDNYNGKHQFTPP